MEDTDGPSVQTRCSGKIQDIPLKKYTNIKWIPKIMFIPYLPIYLLDSCFTIPNAKSSTFHGASQSLKFMFVSNLCSKSCLETFVNFGPLSLKLGHINMNVI